MSEDNELLYDLLVKKAIYGLDDAEQAQLSEIDPGTADAEFRTLEMAAAAIGLSDLEVEPMPAHLRAGIEQSANAYFAQTKAIPVTTEAWPPAPKSREPERSSGSWFGWLGWAVAAAASIALAFNIWFPRVPTEPQVARNDSPVNTMPTPKPMSPTAERDTLASTASDLVKASWAAGNVKGISDIVGDIIWSDEKQAGYMTFRGLPANDPKQETYQLWIMDENQGDKTPIDGGTFDVNSNGEVVIPINARLKAKAPHLFAVTIEKPGGVVVSKREKIAAVAKVETLSQRTS